MPIPVDGEIAKMVRDAAKETGLKQADVMRQGLRHGVPEFVRKMRVAGERHPPKCLDYLDEYPRSTVSAKNYKAALKEKIRKKYDRANR